MNYITKVYQANQSINDVALQIDGTIVALIKDRVRQASLSSPKLWDYELDGWHYFLCQCLMVRWLGGGETIISENPFTSIEVRDARIVARKTNLDVNSIEWKENIIKLAPNYDIRFSFEFISLNQTQVTVVAPANVWDKLLSRITAEWEPVEDEQPIKQSAKGKGGRKKHSSNIWLIEQHLDNQIPLAKLKLEWLEKRKKARLNELVDPDDSMTTVISEEKKRRSK